MTFNPIKIAFRLCAKIASILLFALTVAAAYGGYVPPYLWSIPALLTLVYPYLLIATVVVGLLWLISRTYMPVILAAVTVAASVPAAGVAFPMAWSKTPKQNDTTFSLLTYNILGMRDQEDPDTPYKRSLQYLIDSKADIICLQELYSLPDRNHLSEEMKAQLDTLKSIYPFIINGDYEDFTLLSKYPAVRKDISIPMHNCAARYRVRVNGKSFDILSVHLTSFRLSDDEKGVIEDINSVHTAKEKASEFKHNVLHKLTSAFQERSVNAELVRSVVDDLDATAIVCGDFNDVPASWAYRRLKGDDFTDAYGHCGFGPMITFNKHNFYFHIDHVLYRGNLEALKVSRGNLKASDHYPVLTHFRFTDKAAKSQ